MTAAARTLIANGQVWSDGALRALNILIDAQGKIAALESSNAPNALTQGVDQTIDATGLLVLPGGVDLHVHIQDGAETFPFGTRAAAAGGLTTVVDIAPFHVCCTVAGYQARIQQGARDSVSDFGLSGGIAVVPDDLREMQAIQELGAAYFKVFMPSEPPVNTAFLWECVQTAARTGLRMALHAEEVSCLDPNVNWDDPLGFAHARPAVAETSAAAQALEMARAAGAPIHICHISAGRTAELVDAYRSHGTDVTAETTPHFLLFDESEFLRQGARVKTTPPLRTRADCEMLWNALREGVIDAVACDHWLGELPPRDGALVSMKDKEAGIAGLEVSFPVMYDAAVQGGRLSLERFVQVMASRPAEIAGYSNKGKLAVGADADLVLLDPQAEWVVADLGDFSRIYTTPYVGRRLRGRIRRTLVRGKMVWDGTNITAKSGWGCYIASQHESDSNKLLNHSCYAPT